MGWIQYYKLHPFGDDWDQTATLGHLISIKTAERKLRKPIEKDEMIPYRANVRKERLLKLKHKLDRLRGRGSYSSR